MAHYNPAQQQPVTIQPGNGPPVPPGAPSMQWAQPSSQSIPGCPPGLEYLTQVDQVLCHQIVEILQAFTGWETNNKYSMKNSVGQQIFYIFEETGTCMRICCREHRQFTLHVVNNYNQVEAPPGTVIGRVRQTGAVCAYNYEIQDAGGKAQLTIEGPCCACRCCADVEFPVYSLDKSTRIGCVTKQWGGVAREMFTQADNFGISFPMDLDVKIKATLIGAMFLIDFMAFEYQQRNHGGGGGSGGGS